MSTPQQNTVPLAEVLKQATPLPWETYATFIFGATGNIATVSDPHAKKEIGYAPLEFGSKHWKVASANLAYLCHCANQLPQLVAALEDVLRRINASDQWWMHDSHRGGFDADALEAALLSAKSVPVP